LPGGERSLEDVCNEAAAVIGDEAVRERLVMSYGTRWRDVWEMGASNPGLRERLSPSHAIIGAEMIYGATHEMALTLGDLLVRRTHLAFESSDHAVRIAPVVTQLVAPILGWTNADRDASLNYYEEEVRRVFAISDA
jgi:glycerol-3-phosphate dehydrogenase